MRKILSKIIILIISLLSLSFFTLSITHLNNKQIVEATLYKYTYKFDSNSAAWDSIPTTVSIGDTIRLKSNDQGTTIALYVDEKRLDSYDTRDTIKDYNVENECNVLEPIATTDLGGKLYKIMLQTRASVEYNLNGGNGNTPTNSSKYVYGQEITLASDSNFSRTNYTFKGWSTSSTATSGVTGKYTIQSTDINNGKITFYAIWESNGNTITYNANGADSGSVPIDSNLYKKDVSVTVLGNTASLARNGYTFNGWNTKADGTGTSYSAGNTFSMPDANVTLYAKWTPVDYTITYNLNGGTNDSNNPIKYTIETETITLANPTKTGYIFDGWYTEDTYINKTTDIYQDSTGDITLYARWVNYEYSYSSTGWDKSVETSYTQGDIIKISFIGVSFTHFEIGVNGNKAGNFGTNMPGFYTIVNTGATIQLCASPKIQVNITDVPVYSITYNLDGGTNSSSNPNTYIKSETAITLENPTKTGFKFLGWYDNNSFTGSKITTIPADATGDKAFYAKWEEKATISINDNIQRFIYDGNNKTPTIKDLSGNLITLSEFNYTYDVYTTDYETCYESKRPGLYKINITRAEDETYKAVNTYIEYVVTYSVTYKANTGVGDDIVDDADDNFNHIEYFGQYVDTLPEKYLCDKKAKIISNTFTKENYTFSFWNTKQDGTGDLYRPDDLATITENLVLYACYSVNISAQPTKDNNYTISVLTSDTVSYIWEKEAIVITPVDLSTITVNPGTVNTNNNTITAVLQGDIYTITIICNDYTKSLMFYTEGSLLDGVTGVNNVYTYSSFGFKTRIYNITSNQVFTISNINYYGSGYTEISNETSNSILNANENTNYRCKIKSIFNGITYSDVITPNSISFEDTTGATGTAPNSIYQLEGRKITIPNNTFTRTGFNFIGWTLSTVYQPNDEYTVSSSNVTFNATWKAIESVLIDKASQPHTYSGNSFDFVIDGNVETGFIIYYAVHSNSDHLESDWQVASPINVNSYDVRITRSADDSYYSYDDEIKNGLVISKATYNMTNAKWDYSSAFTYDGNSKTVTVIDLPTGVTATYLNNTETNVSRYTAKAILSYDETNYNPIAIPDLEWEILIGQVVITLSNDSNITVNKGETVTLPEATSNFGTVTCNKAATDLVNPGTYKVTYTVPGTSNYNGATKEITVTINNNKYQNEVKDNLTEDEVKVESSIGLSSTINLEVTVKALANNILDNIQTIIDYSSNLKKNERISKLYDIKLMITEGNSKRELTKDELEDGTEFTVKIKVPTDLNGKSFKLLHVHSKEDITEVTLGSEAKVGEYILDNDGYLITKINKFSEFAFIYEVNEPNSSFPWWAIILIVLGILIVLFVGLFFVWKYEFDKTIKNEEDLNDRKLRFLDIVYKPIYNLIFIKEERE